MPSDAHEVWMAGAVRHLANLDDDGPYLAEVQTRLRAEYGTDNEKALAAFATPTNFPVGKATHSSQDGYDWNRLRLLLEAADIDYGQPLLIRDGKRFTVYDGNHRYVAARIRGDRTIPVRLLTLAGPHECPEHGR